MVVDDIKRMISDAVTPQFESQGDYISKISQWEVENLKSFFGEQSQIVERDRANMLQNIFAVNQSLEALIRKVDTLQNSIDSLMVAQTAKNNKNESSAAVSKPENVVYYSKMVDSANPVGFKLSNLKKNNEGCAFKIVLNDENGYYECVDDAEIQHELLAAFNPLISDSSVYTDIPQNATQINVVKKGTVIKEKDVLRIIDKQILEFV
jgi:hypothetical protein